MTDGTWSDWQIAQLNECLMRGIGPQEAGALLGKPIDEVCAKVRQMGLLFAETSEDSPSILPNYRQRQTAN